jgi:hypothetical protein
MAYSTKAVATDITWSDFIKTANVVDNYYIMTCKYCKVYVPLDKKVCQRVGRGGPDGVPAT